MATVSTRKVFSLNVIASCALAIPEKPRYDDSDPQETVKTDIIDGLDQDALTWDDDETHLKYLVLIERPPMVLMRDLIVDQEYDLIFTVGHYKTFHRRVVQNKPKKAIGIYRLGIWTVDKPGRTSEKIKWKALKELRRVLRAETYEQTDLEKPDDYLFGAQRLYNTLLFVKHLRFWFPWPYTEFKIHVDDFTEIATRVSKIFTQICVNTAEIATRETLAAYITLCVNSAEIATRQSETFTPSVVNSAEIATRQSETFTPSTVDSVEIADRESQTFTLTVIDEIDIL